jgi:peptidoglycan hydrolase CwlO-like protein
MNALSEEKQGLSTRLATQVGALVQVQDELSMFEENRALIDDDIIVTTSDLSNQQSIKNTLLNTIERESKLRADTHPIAVNTSLNDTEKTNETQAALNAYDNYQAGPSEPGRAQPFSGLQLQSSVNSIFVPPTSAQIQSTITALTSELSRVQLQINTVNSQISAKQGEITATENEIVELQNLIESLENDKIYWQNQYNYWKGEYKRLYAIHENAFYAAVEMQSYYRYAKEDLEAV